MSYSVQEQLQDPARPFKKAKNHCIPKQQTQTPHLTQQQAGKFKGAAQAKPTSTGTRPKPTQKGSGEQDAEEVEIASRNFLHSSQAKSRGRTKLGSGHPKATTWVKPVKEAGPTKQGVQCNDGKESCQPSSRERPEGKRAAVDGGEAESKPETTFDLTQMETESEMRQQIQARLRRHLAKRPNPGDEMNR